MNKPLDEEGKWILLKSYKPSVVEKEVLKERISNSLSQESSSNQRKFLQWRGILATCLLALICGGLLWQLIEGSDGKQQSFFSWELKDVHVEEKNGELLLYQEDVPVGNVKEVTKEEQNQIISSSPMFVNEQLDNFPYPTTMYIEHVKTMETMQRYHFFIEDKDGKSIYFSFDYPKLEYAEIFDAMYKLRLKGREPYLHHEQLYVRHGYGELIFPVGLKPLTINTEKEVYYWDKASDETFNAYLHQIEEQLPAWERIANIFTSSNGDEVVKITLDEKELTYEFSYPNREE